MEQDPFCEIPGESWAESQKRFDEYWAREMEELRAIPEEIAKAAAQIHEDCGEVRNIIMSKPKSEREAYIGDAVMEPGFSLELPVFLERQWLNEKKSVRFLVEVCLTLCKGKKPGKVGVT